MLVLTFYFETRFGCVWISTCNPSTVGGRGKRLAGACQLVA